jgi:hypothetical protein
MSASVVIGDKVELNDCLAEVHSTVQDVGLHLTMLPPAQLLTRLVFVPELTVGQKKTEHAKRSVSRLDMRLPTF